ncbi:MAG TPA: DUF2892 domain-containing protein [Candidatus Nanoarchaeia archaeon]|nr:DUF2892 domain-containing protein [Candidatus Nanoarchaeia archaeon]
MKKNLGIGDRVFRFILGVILLYLGYSYFDNGFFSWLLIVIGAIGVIESFISYCGLYQLFGINTYGGKNGKIK